MKLLNLFCGEGLADWGYWNSGHFSEIVGIDLNPDLKKAYAFDFIPGDALACNYEFLSQFDVIHASPPCQPYSTITPPEIKKTHAKLILQTKLMLHASGKPHIVENVPGAKRELRPNCVINGLYFGLKSDRPRYFYLSTLAGHYDFTTPGRGLQIHGREYVDRDALIEAFGLRGAIHPNRLKNITRVGIEQGVPPSMTTLIANLMFINKPMIGERAK